MKPAYYFDKYPNLFGRSGQIILANAARSSLDNRPIYDVWGFHIYLALKLRLQVSAADNGQDAARFVRLMADTASAVEACARESGVDLLEVQTDKMHMFLPSPDISLEAQKRVFTFCTALAQMIEERIRPRDPEAWEGFAMAADHGRSVLINNTWDSSASIVSLGDCANAPAKRLYSPGVAHGRLVYDANWAKAERSHSQRDWKEVNLLSEAQVVPVYLQRDLVNSFNSKVSERLQAKTPLSPLGLIQAKEFVESFSAGNFTSATRVQGYFLRADLDGFTARVREAFNAGNSAILALVEEFISIMASAQDFIKVMESKGSRVIQLAWAGDCANMILFPPSNISYADSRAAAPFNLSLEWHEKAGRQNAKWAVGVAGGGEDEGNGLMVVAPISADGRIFNIPAGWAVQRSLDAQESEGMGAEMSALHKEDWGRLEKFLRDAYGGINTFRKATLAALRSAQSKMRDQLKVSAPATVSGVSILTPKPTPYYDSRRFSTDYHFRRRGSAQ
jgi:hypothetical protein